MLLPLVPPQTFVYRPARALRAFVRNGLPSNLVGKGNHRSHIRSRISSILKVGADALMDPLMDPLLTDLELAPLDGREHALRAMVERERAQRIEAQERAKRLERKLKLLDAGRDPERDEEVVEFPTRP